MPRMYVSQQPYARQIPAGSVFEKMEKLEICVLLFHPDTTKRIREVRKHRTTKGSGSTGSRFWRLSLGVLYGLANKMIVETTSKPPDAQRGGGIFMFELARAPPGMRKSKPALFQNGGF